jgi:dipeptidyl aminopeptidase/acylaminoacyl peptidase
MQITLGLLVPVLGLLCADSMAAADARPSMDAFFSGPHLRQAYISPDGRFLALVTELDSRETVTVVDRHRKTPPMPVVVPDADDHVSIDWCNWVNDTRLLCSLLAVNDRPVLNLPGWPVSQQGKFHPETRLLAVNADGSQPKPLLKGRVPTWATIRDRIIDWTPDDPRTVMINLPDGSSATMQAYSLDVYSGSLKLVERGKFHVAGFRTDGKGNVRLATGLDLEDEKYRVYAKLLGKGEWNLVLETKYSPLGDYFSPIAVIPDTDDMYATRPHNGFRALWKVDLAGKREPELLYAADDREVSPIFGEGHRFLGVMFIKDRVHAHFVDEEAELLQAIADKSLPGRINTLQDFTRDMQTAVVRSESDSAAPSFHLISVVDGQAKRERIGDEFPGLRAVALAPMRTVTFPASDGSKVPAYLTIPAGASTGKLPFVVLPHGGPYARDFWGFDSWVQFLAAKGFGVLQVQFRGSAGFGTEWMKASFGDWGGKAYSDVFEGAEWLTKQENVDPTRLCIVGASFGGYMALQAAVRNPELFQCAVSISGVSDLNALLATAEQSGGHSNILRDQIGREKETRRKNSPALRAREIGVPIMLIHGAEDYTVEAEQTRMMADALKAQGKPHEVVIIGGADHYFRHDIYRRQLFVTIGRFLDQHLKSATTN